MKRNCQLIFWGSIVLILAFSIWFSLIGQAVANRIEASPGSFVTATSNYYERDPELLKASSGTWFLVYAKSQTTYSPGGNPDILVYDVYYSTSTNHGATWTECNPSKRMTLPGAIFWPASITEADGKIWIIAADLATGDIYYQSSSDNGNNWSSPTRILVATQNIGSFHLDALADGNNIWVFFAGWSLTDGIYYIKYDGTTDTWGTSVQTLLGSYRMPRVIKDGSTFRMVTTTWSNISYSTTSDPALATWNTVNIPGTEATSGGSAADPTIFKDSDGIIWVAYAPWFATDKQRIEYLTSSNNGTTWSSSLPFTAAEYGLNYWWDFRPYVDKDGSDMLFFITSEKNSPMVTRGVADILMFRFPKIYSGNAHFEGIQPAISFVSSGDNIYVAVGTYNESVTIDKSVTITGDRGNDMPGPGLNPPILDGSTLGGNVSAFSIASGVSNVIIQGFEITNYGPDGNTNADGVVAWNAGTSNIIVRDNYFHHLGYAGVLVGNGWGGPQGVHDGWTVSGNIISNFAGYALDMENTQNTQLINNQISSPTYSTIQGIMILALADPGFTATSSNITVKGNNFTNFPDRAICLVTWAQDNTASATLQDVTVSGNTVTTNFHGISLWKLGTGTNAIQNLTIKSNAITVNNPKANGYAVDLSDVGGASVFDSNTVLLTGALQNGVTWFHGVNVGGASTGTWNMDNNRLDGNNLGTSNVGIRLRGTLPSTVVINITKSIIAKFANGISSDALPLGADINVHNNDIMGNSVKGINDGNGAIIDAENNYWGDASGPLDNSGTDEASYNNCFPVETMKNSDGLGNAVSDYVDYCPWLTSSTILPIPTLTEWGLMIFGALLVLSLIWVIRKRMKRASIPA
jgi:hypothetical protein